VTTTSVQFIVAYRVKNMQVSAVYDTAEASVQLIFAHATASVQPFHYKAAASYKIGLMRNDVFIFCEIQDDYHFLLDVIIAIITTFFAKCFARVIIAIMAMIAIIACTK
jgi:hypothetical protein